MSSHCRTSRSFAALILPILIVTATTGRSLAQGQNPGQRPNVEVQDAGGGNKTELVRNAAGEVVENRTIDANGRVRSIVKMLYLPGHYVPDTESTSYYPDGKTIENYATVNYDPNANFLSEVIEQFDNSGKHSSGHKVLHDPINGEFRCWKWIGQSQKYDRVVCPSGEESGEKPPPLKLVSQDEAVKMFEAARVAAAAEQKSRRMTTKNPVRPPITPQDTRFSVVLPAALVPGKQVSGSILDNTYLFRQRPDLILEDVTLPLVPGSEAAKLSGWQIEIAGAPPQRADAPFTFSVPRASQMNIKIYPEGDPAKAVTRSIGIPKSTASGKPSSSYAAQVLCVVGDVCPISGTFDGDATKALAALDERPAVIAAETSDMVFVRVPEDVLLVGQKQLLFRESNELLTFPVVIAQVDVVADGIHLDTFQRDIKQGDKKLVFAGTIGVQDLPEENWHAGVFSKTNLEWARRFAPDFEVPRESHAQREEREMMEKMEQQEKGVKSSGKKKEVKMGTIVYFLKNTTPDVVSWRGSKDQVFVLPLNSESFSQGDYRYKFVVEASKTGTYSMDLALIPFVAPIQGQKFTLPTGVTAQ